MAGLAGLEKKNFSPDRNAGGLDGPPTISAIEYVPPPPPPPVIVLATEPSPQKRKNRFANKENDDGGVAYSTSLLKSIENRAHR